MDSLYVLISYVYNAPATVYAPAQQEVPAMSRKYIGCREFPSDISCSVAIFGTEDEVLDRAGMHARTTHGYKDTHDLRNQLRSMLKDAPEIKSEGAMVPRHHTEAHGTLIGRWFRNARTVSCSTPSQEHTARSGLARSPLAQFRTRRENCPSIPAPVSQPSSGPGAMPLAMGCRFRAFDRC
jgi:predicted small metal-binding protein